jgi:predicted enzyme related to lactoylglutathione lyase
MHGDIAHVAINAGDVGASLRFYAALFGWEFNEYAAGFHRAPLPAGLIAAVQQRRDLLPDAPTTGLEVTFEADDLDAVAAAVTANGGRILMEKTAIPGVGELVFFADPGGNVAGAIRYEAVNA